MAINADKPQQWKKDIAASVDLFNRWFIKFAPKTYRDTRLKTTEFVEDALSLTNDLRSITPDVLAKHPKASPRSRVALPGSTPRSPASLARAPPTLRAADRGRRLSVSTWASARRACWPLT